MSRQFAATRAVPRLLIAILLVVIPVSLTWGGAAPAHADEGDKITEFDADYRIETSGTIRVTETINYHFGDSHERGISRDLRTRQHYDRIHDQKFTVHIVSVSSPTGASAQYRTSSKSDDGVGYLEVKIGDPDRYVPSQNQTYKIVYTVQGAVHDFVGEDQLDWYVLGTRWDAPFGKVKITATAPGGVQAVNCGIVRFRLGSGCTSAKIKGGTVFITQNGLPPSADMAMNVGIKNRLDDDEPALVFRSDLLIMIIGGGLTVLSLIISVLGGWRISRSLGSDQRYLYLPPGTLPEQGKPAHIGRTTKIEIPVRSTPPEISVGEARLLVDGQFQHRDTAATLVDLAVRGAIRLEADLDPDADNIEVLLLDRSRATRPHERELLDGIFGATKSDAKSASPQQLGGPGCLTDADANAANAARDEVEQRNWFRHLPPRSGKTSPLQKLAWGLGIVGLILFCVVVYLAFRWVLTGDIGITIAIIVALLPLVFAAAHVLGNIPRRGVRTADGRAVCDQVVGFRTYLATVEAEQLQFEEGQDIFSAYLPWAMAFNLADRWTKVCAKLVELGRIPDRAPDWYVGDLHLATFNVGVITNSVRTSVAASNSIDGRSRKRQLVSS